MDSGIAAVVGSVLGGFGTFAATWLSGYQKRLPPDRSEKVAKALLKELLEAPNCKWRKLETLASVVGMSETTVQRWLLDIGARGSMNDARYWGLISRNPFARPEDDEASLESESRAAEKEKPHYERWRSAA